MKRKNLLQVFAIAMLLPVGASAQGRFMNPTYDFKKHQFGFGVSTTLLDDVRTFNQYLNIVGYSVRRFSLHTDESSLFCIYFDYQYHFNDNWSIEARLKYKHRHTIQTLWFVVDDTYGLNGSLNSVYRDIAIPITANYRWLSQTGSSFEVFAGAGMTTLGLWVEGPATVGFPDYPPTLANVGIEYDRSVDVYGILGFQFDIPYGAFTVKPFVSLSYSPIANGRYTVTPEKPTTLIPNKATSLSMRTCEIECGLTMQF